MTNDDYVRIEYSEEELCNRFKKLLETKTFDDAWLAFKSNILNETNILQNGRDDNGLS